MSPAHEKWPYQLRYGWGGNPASAEDDAIGIAIGSKSEIDEFRRRQQQQQQKQQQQHHLPSPKAYHRPSIRDSPDRIQPSSRLSRMSLSRMSHHSHHSDSSSFAQTASIAYECCLRILSACLASATIATSAVTFALARDTPPSADWTPAAAATNPLFDARLSCIVGVPVGSAALAWQLVRLGLFASGVLDGVLDSVDTLTTPLWMASLVVELVIAGSGVVCSILAGVQASHHKRHSAGCDIALAVLLALLATASLGILAAASAAELRGRQARKTAAAAAAAAAAGEQRRVRSPHSVASSVIEIIG